MIAELRTGVYDDGRTNHTHVLSTCQVKALQRSAETKDRHRSGTRRQQGTRAGCGCRAGGDEIIDEEDVLTGCAASPCAIGPAYVVRPPLMRYLRLPLSPPDAHKCVDIQWNSRKNSQNPPDPFRLVESPLPLFSTVHRDRNQNMIRDVRLVNISKAK